MILLGLHVLILRKRGGLYNKTFIGLLSLYLFYILTVFVEAYVEILGQLVSCSSDQPEKISKFAREYVQAGDYLRSMGIQVLITILSLKDILAQFKLNKKTQEFASIENLRLNKKNYYTILKLLSVFMKDILLFYVVSNFLTRPNIFKLVYLCCYLKYFFSQFYSLGKVFSKFHFEEMFLAKIRYYKNNLLSPDTKKGPVEMEFYAPEFTKLNGVYYQLFNNRIFKKFYKEVNENWVFNFVVVFIYLITLFYFSSEGIGRNGRFVVLNYFLNWKTTDNFIEEEYEQTLIVLIVSVFEVYFLNILNSQFTKDDKQLIKTVPNLLLFRYFFGK